MDINDPRWDEYETRFRALAERATHVKVPHPPLDRCAGFLCLYGENGLAPDAEFDLLARLEAAADQEPLHRLEVETSYWQDTVVFVPRA